MKTGTHSMIFSEAEKNDLIGILSIYSYLDQEVPPAGYEEALKIWDTVITDKMQKYFIAKDNSAVISTCNIAIIPNLTNEGRSFAVIENVVTHPDYRRRGIGRKVMKMAIDYAKTMGCYKILLLSNIRRAEAHRFYEALGFNGDSKKGFHMKIQS